MSLKFSVLMSIYAKENPLFFNRAMLSIWDGQELKPDEILIVQEGNVTEELRSLIINWKNKLGDIIKVFFVEERLGLAKSLAVGVEIASYELVARMDADDISLPSRFKRQIAFLKHNPNVDVCGTWICEFCKDEDKIISYKKMPTSFKRLKNYSKYRTPLNHPSVMFKKQAVLSVGNYKDDFLCEDWFLWNRMLLAGFTMANIPEYLVKMCNLNMIERRLKLNSSYSGIIRFNFYFFKRGYYSLVIFLISTFVQCLVWSIPKFILKLLYKHILRNTKL